MGLFFKKKEQVDENVIYSPIKGELKDITTLKDKTFAEKVMGDGIAIIPTEGKVYAPCNGTINALLDTHHAYGLTSDAGFDILIHIGQDTVNLKGEGFASKVKEGQHVKKGDLLGTFDIDSIKAKGYNLATPVILIVGGDYKIVSKSKSATVNVGDVLLNVSK